MRVLDDHGFFDGQVMPAIRRMNRFVQERRVAAGGVLVVSMFPVRSADGTTVATAARMMATRWAPS